MSGRRRVQWPDEISMALRDATKGRPADPSQPRLESVISQTADPMRGIGTRLY